MTKRTDERPNRTQPIITSRLHSGVPGDTSRELTAPAWSLSDDVEYPIGTVYQPLSCGYNALTSCVIQVVMIRGRRVSFAAYSTQSHAEEVR